MTREAVIVAGSRTAVGKSKRGTTRNWRSDDMAAAVIQDILRKAPAVSYTHLTLPTSDLV